MKLILLENVKGVGKKDEIINANDGYARNYLLPKKLALEANNENLSKLKAKQSSNEHRKQEEKSEAEQMKEKLSKILLKIEVKSGENGKIFGGVTAKEISEQLKKQHNFDIDKKKIDVKETIKTLGTFNIDVKLYEGVIGKVKIDIISK
jgi:large subunit ribosomal protein L9